MTEELAKLFKRLKWIKYIRFSYDTMVQLPYFEKVVGWLQKHGIGVSKIFVYVLVQKNLSDANERVQGLFQLNKNINIYAQVERNERKGIGPDRAQKEFAQRYVYGRSYKKESWEQYCKRNQFDGSVNLI